MDVLDRAKHQGSNFHGHFGRTKCPLIHASAHTALNHIKSIIILQFPNKSMRTTATSFLIFNSKLDVTQLLSILMKSVLLNVTIFLQQHILSHRVPCLHLEVYETLVWPSFIGGQVWIPVKQADGPQVKSLEVVTWSARKNRNQSKCQWSQSIENKIQENKICYCFQEVILGQEGETCSGDRRSSKPLV